MTQEEVFELKVFAPPDCLTVTLAYPFPRCPSLAGASIFHNSALALFRVTVDFILLLPVDLGRECELIKPAGDPQSLVVCLAKPPSIDRSGAGDTIHLKKACLLARPCLLG